MTEGPTTPPKPEEREDSGDSGVSPQGDVEITEIAGKKMPEAASALDQALPDRKLDEIRRGFETECL